MQLLTQEVGLLRQQHIGAFNLAEIEALHWQVIRGRHDWADKVGNRMAKVLRDVHDPRQTLLFFGLERQTDNFVLPLLEVF